MMGPFALPFDALRDGERWVSGTRTITEADVVGFAELTDDWHPQHTDAQWAAGSVFGERIAHGMLVLSVAVGLLPLDPERILALRRIRDAVLKRPVALGDTVRVEARIGERRAIDEATGLVSCEWRILNQDERLVARADVEVLWRREAQPVADTDGAADPGWAAFCVEREDELLAGGLPPL